MERIDRYNIERFIEAQANETRGYLVALKEIKSGRKHEHWIWYIFPQAKGLGKSPKSELYGISCKEEALEYLNHPLLGQRLREATLAFSKQEHKDAYFIFNSDAKKVRSCMELFASVDESEEQLFQQVLADFTF
jgi:uncharacterized protein (DUF1810 family)